MRLVRLAVGRPVGVWMAVAAAVVFGLVALGRLDMRLLPEIRYPTLTVQTEFPNTAPADVENLVTRPLEEAVGVVPGLLKVSSVSQAGLSQVTLEFDWGTRMDYAALDVRDKIDLVELPEDALAPVILKYDPALDPVLRVGLTGDLPLVRLRNLAEEVVKKEIEGLRGVAAARVSGGLEEEVQVTVDQERLAGLGLDLAGVEQALAAESVNTSGGRLQTEGASYVVRTLSRYDDLDDLRRVTVGSAGGRPVRLEEVADVSRGHKEREVVTHARGRESVEIGVFKEGDASVVQVADRVRHHLDRLGGRLPEGARLEVLFDESTYIRRAVAEVRDNALLGGLLAIMVLLLFLRDLRSTLVIAIAIPVSIVATFVLMYTQGVSLNVMSLGGLALGVGLLVDNGIVVLEAIHRRRERGEEATAAAVGGAGEVAGAVTASTLTTVAVFVPVVFVVVGIAGQIFRDQALTVTFSLLVSLVVALTFTPMAVAWGRRRRAPAGGEPAAAEGPGGRRLGAWLDEVPPGRGPRWLRAVGPLLTVGIPVVLLALAARFLRAVRGGLARLLRGPVGLFDAGFRRAERTYAGVLGAALRRRARVLGLVLVLLLAAVAVFRGRGADLVPPLAQGEFTLAVTMPEGTPLGRTESAVRGLEAELGRVPGVAMVTAEVGTGREGAAGMQRRRENWAEVHVRLERAGGRLEERVLARARALAAARPEMEVKLRHPSLLSFSAPIEVDLYGHDLDRLQEAADRVAAALAPVAGLSDVRRGMEPGSPEVRITFDRDKLDRQGLSMAAAAATVRGQLAGTVPGRLHDRERQVDVRLLGRPEDRGTLASLQTLLVAERDGVGVPLGAVATYEVVGGPAEIHRLGNRRVAAVTADLSGRDLESAVAEVRGVLGRLALPAGVTAELGGQEDEMRDGYRSLRLAVLLAVFLVYLVMAAQFESFLHPLVIMATVPLALVGAVFALALAGLPISVVAGIGAVMLAGIVVNNGIVLVDRANQLRRRLPPGEAVRLAARERFRPILMTTATTVLGLLPMALGVGEGAELRAPLAIAVIGGLLLSTVLTLVVVPVAWTLLTPGGAAAWAPAPLRAARSAAVVAARPRREEG